MTCRRFQGREKKVMLESNRASPCSPTEEESATRAGNKGAVVLNDHVAICIDGNVEGFMDQVSISTCLSNDVEVVDEGKHQGAVVNLGGRLSRESYASIRRSGYEPGPGDVPRHKLRLRRRDVVVGRLRDQDVKVPRKFDKVLRSTVIVAVDGNRRAEGFEGVRDHLGLGWQREHQHRKSKHQGKCKKSG